MKMRMKQIGLALFALVLFAGGPSGCKSSRLDPKGVYQGDKFLYEAENAIVTAHDTFRQFLQWELSFRSVLPPEVSRAADFVRLNEEKWISTASALRDAYERTPSPEAKDRLQLSINLIRTALHEAASYMVSNKSRAPNEGLKGITPVTVPK
jgi:hypothetical protein